MLEGCALDSGEIYLCLSWDASQYAPWCRGDQFRAIPKTYGGRTKSHSYASEEDQWAELRNAIARQMHHGRDQSTADRTCEDIADSFAETEDAEGHQGGRGLFRNSSHHSPPHCSVPGTEEPEEYREDDERAE